MKLCLDSIAQQDYPKQWLEIIIADGGSTEGTLEIALRHTYKIHPNPRKTGKSGKEVALKHASGEIVAFIDSQHPAFNGLASADDRTICRSGNCRH